MYHYGVKIPIICCPQKNIEIMEIIAESAITNGYILPQSLLILDERNPQNGYIGNTVSRRNRGSANEIYSNLPLKSSRKSVSAAAVSNALTPSALFFSLRDH